MAQTPRQRVLLALGALALAGLALFPSVRLQGGATPSGRTPIIYRNSPTDGIAFLFNVRAVSDIDWLQTGAAMGAVAGLVGVLYVQAGRRRRPRLERDKDQEKPR
jgi:hypothetical protein